MTKEEIVGEIARRIGVASPRMSTGSTEPREIFELVNESLGLRLEAHGHLTKPDLARGIVEAAGLQWLPTYESHGGTVTRPGLLGVLKAVELLLGPR
ncbi:MAG: hypothetical protein WD942_07365 [Dehalococcoidia bacterium]